MSDLRAAVPDGIALTTDGSLVISCYRPDIIYRWREDMACRCWPRKPRASHLRADERRVHRPDLDTMVVPNIGRWHLTRIRAGLRGVGLHYPTAEQLGG